MSFPRLYLFIFIIFLFFLFFWRKETRGHQIYMQSSYLPVTQEWALLHFLAVKYSRSFLLQKEERKESEAKLFLVLK